MTSPVILYDTNYIKNKNIRKRQKRTLAALSQLLGVSYDRVLLQKALSDPSRWNYTATTLPLNKKVKYSWTKPNGKSIYVKASRHKTDKVNKVTMNPSFKAMSSVVTPEQNLFYIKAWMEFHKNRHPNQEWLPAFPLKTAGKLPVICKPVPMLNNLNYNNSNTKRHIKIQKYFNVMLNPASDFGTRYMVDVADPAWYGKLLKNTELALKHRLAISGDKKGADDLVLKELVTYPKYKKAKKLKLNKLEQRGEINLIPIFVITPRVFGQSRSGAGMSIGDNLSVSRQNVRGGVNTIGSKYTANVGEDQDCCDYGQNVGSRIFSSYFMKNRTRPDGTSVTHSSLGTGSTTYPPPPLPPIDQPLGFQSACGQNRYSGCGNVYPAKPNPVKINTGGETTTITLTSTTSDGANNNIATTFNNNSCREPVKYTCIKKVKTLKCPESHQTTGNPYCNKYTLPKTKYHDGPYKEGKPYVHMCHEIVDSDCPEPSSHHSMVKTSDLHETVSPCDYNHKSVKNRPINDVCLNGTLATPPIYSPDKLCKLKRFFKLFRKSVITELPQVLATLDSANDYIKFMKGEETAWAEKSTMLDVLKKYQEEKKNKKATISEITEMGSKLDISGKDEPTTTTTTNEKKGTQETGVQKLSDEGNEIFQDEIGAKSYSKKEVGKMTREQLLRNSSASFVFQIITGEIKYNEYELGDNFEEFLAIFFPKDDLRVMMAVVEIIVPELADFIHNLLKDREIMKSVLSKKQTESTIRRQLSTLDLLIKGKIDEHKNLIESAFKEAEVRKEEEKLRAENDILQTTGIVEKMDNTTVVYNEVDSDEDDGGEETTTKFGLAEAMQSKKPDISETLMGSDKYNDDISETLLESEKLPEFIDPTTKFAIEETRKLINDYESKVKKLNNDLENLKKEEVAHYTILVKNKEKQYLNFGEFQNTVSSLNKDPRVSTEEYTNMLKLMSIGARVNENGEFSLEDESSDGENSSAFDNQEDLYNQSSDWESKSPQTFFEPERIGSNMSRPPYVTPADLLIDHRAIEDTMFEVPENCCGYNSFEANLVLNEDKLATRAEVLKALSDYKNDTYDLENQLDNGMLEARVKNEALKPGLNDVFTDDEFMNLMNGYLTYDKDLVTRDEASLIADETVCKYVSKKITEQDEKLERMRLAALKNQAAGICNPPVDQKGGTTTITLTTNSSDFQ